MKSFDPNNLELGVSEIAQRVGLSKSTANRMLATLVYGGLLEQNAETSKYMIGSGLFNLGTLYLISRDIVKVAEPIVKELNELAGEVTNVHIRDQGYSTIVLREESKHTFRFAYHVGSVFPAYSVAAGKALLSVLTDAEIDSLYPHERLTPLTQKTLATRTELKKQLEQIRKTGVAFQSEENRNGVEAVASVIRDVTGTAVAAISIAMPVFMTNQARREQLATLVRMGASLTSYRFGYRDTVNPVRTIEEIRAWWERNQKSQLPNTSSKPGKKSPLGNKTS
jgi:DNA-binding IclR family transcriptional regulator